MDHNKTLEGSVAIVTGANSGLGYETALMLARSGAEVLMACRNHSKGSQALDSIKATVSDANVRLVELNLASLESIRRFSTRLEAEVGRVDILVNNAGVMALPERRLTEDGFEMQFGTNHLGHFALTGLLLRLLGDGPSRVVTVSSFAHRYGRMDFDDLQGENRYMKWMAYGQSKLANLLFTFELQRFADENGMPVKSVGAHPGFAATHLQDGTSFGPLRVFARSAAEGAIPINYAATSPDVRSGEFYGPGIAPGRRHRPIRAVASPAARNQETAKRLWRVSEELTGVDFTSLLPEL